MKKPYLDYILDGKKTIESRATKVKCPPFRKVSKGDIIYFKESGEHIIIAKANVVKTKYVSTKEDTQKYLEKYMEEIGINEEYIQQKKDAIYLSLFWLSNIKRIVPFSFIKKDRRAWIVNFIKYPSESLEVWIKDNL